MADNRPPTKSQIYQEIADETELTKKQVSAVFDALTSMIDKQLSKGKKTDSKTFTVPGLCKIVTKYKPATKGGEKKINPFTKEEIITKPKEASQTVKIRPLKALKDMVA